jgi:hypothetical protein
MAVALADDVAPIEYLVPREVSPLVVPRLRRAPLSPAVRQLLEQNHRHWCWGGVSTNVARIRLAFEREAALAWPLPPRPGVTFLFADWLEDWKPPRLDIWGDAGFRLRSPGSNRRDSSIAVRVRDQLLIVADKEIGGAGWPDSIVRCPPVSVRAPLDESPALSGVSSAISYAALVARDLREAARARSPRRADRRSYRAALFPPTWPRAEIAATRHCEAYDREFARFPSRRL